MIFQINLFLQNLHWAFCWLFLVEGFSKRLFFGKKCCFLEIFCVWMLRRFNTSHLFHAWLFLCKIWTLWWCHWTSSRWFHAIFPYTFVWTAYLKVLCDCVGKDLVPIGSLFCVFYQHFPQQLFQSTWNLVIFGELQLFFLQNEDKLAYIFFFEWTKSKNHSVEHNS